MKSIFVSALSPRSGKTIITLGLALNSRVFTGFFKPFQEKMITVNGLQVEEDAYLMQSVIDFEADQADLSPFPKESIETLTMGQLLEAYGRVSINKELMIVEGVSLITTGFLHGLSGFDIAERLGSDIILLSNTDPASLDRLAMIKHYMDYRGTPLKGAILNFCDDVGIENFLAGKGIPVLGSMPYTPSLTTLHVFEIVEALGGLVLAGNERLDNSVNRVIIGAMGRDSALRYFERVPDKAVITGGDRNDISLAALGTSTAGLILTGGLMPSQEVIDRARALGVPLVSVREDTLAASEAVERLIARIDPHDEKKIKLIKDEVAKNIDVNRILR